MRKIVAVNSNLIWSTTPTLSGEIPQTKAITKQTAFDIHIFQDDYRNREFLNLNLLPQVEVEFMGIKNIWDNNSKKSREYTLFQHCHVRKTVGEANLNIDFNELKDFLKCPSTGQIIINGEALSNGFAITTENTIYYGTLNNDTVIELCISQWNNNSINEIIRINKAFNILFVDWYNCNLVKNE